VPEAITFWICFVLASLIYFFSYTYQRRVERRNSRELRQAIMHAPPMNWIKEFIVQLGRSGKTVDNIEASSSKENIEYAIRVVLHSVAQLVSKLSPLGGRRVAANIMIYYPSAGMAEAEITRLDGKLKFCDPNIGIPKLRGVLDLDKVLSTALTEGQREAEPDAKLRPFCLAIPNEVKTREGKLRLGPGAPYAYACNDPAYFSDSQKLLQWVKENADFKPEVLLEFEQHFGRDTPTRSFVSLPIRDTDTDPVTVVGILSVHADKLDLLPLDQEMRNMVYETLMAFNPILVKLLKRWKEHKGVPASAS
jgi:hypothetical protein